MKLLGRRADDADDAEGSPEPEPISDPAAAASQGTTAPKGRPTPKRNDRNKPRGPVAPAPTTAAEARQRRKQAHGLSRLLQQLIGIEAKLRQYEEGERFIAAVEAVGGPALLDNAWRGPQWLPSLEEIREPSIWITRVGAAATLVP